MKIYNRLVISICSGEILSESSYEYSGPIAECKSGGGSQLTTTVDPVYNAGLLEIYGLASEKSVEYDNLFKYGVLYNPEETQEGLMIDGKWVPKDKLTAEQIGGDQWIDNPDYKAPSFRQVTDPETNQTSWVQDPGSGSDVPQKILNPNFKLESRTLGEVNQYDPNAHVSELQLMQRQLESSSNLLPLQEQLQRTQLEADTRLTPLRAQTEEATLGLEQSRIADASTALAERAPLRSKFFQAAGEGIDPTQRMDQAQASVQQSSDLQDRNLKRELAVSQVNPGDPAYAQMLNSSALARSKNIAAARTTAKNTAEDESFKRLALAASYGV